MDLIAVDVVPADDPGKASCYRCAWCQEAYWTSKGQRRFCCEQCMVAGFAAIRDGAKVCERCRQAMIPAPAGRRKYCHDCLGKGEALPKKYLYRADIFRRDGYACVYCGVLGKDRKSPDDGRSFLQVDHIVPLSKGGPTTAANVATACAPCNKAKGKSLLSADRQAEILAIVAARNASDGIDPDRVCSLGQNSRIAAVSYMWLAPGVKPHA